MFGSTKSDRLSHDNFLADPFGRSILQAEGLIGPLVEIGSHVVTNVVEVFTGLPPGHQLFERYAFSRTIDFERMIEMSESLARQDARSSLDAQTEQQLVAIALGYIEPRHRYNLIDDTFRRRILRARARSRTSIFTMSPSRSLARRCATTCCSGGSAMASPTPRPASRRSSRRP
jgi:putative ABC transport system ATP-binding protein